MLNPCVRTSRETRPQRSCVLAVAPFCVCRVSFQTRAGGADSATKRYKHEFSLLSLMKLSHGLVSRASCTSGARASWLWWSRTLQSGGTHPLELPEGEEGEEGEEPEEHCGHPEQDDTVHLRSHVWPEKSPPSSMHLAA